MTEILRTEGLVKIYRRRKVVDDVSIRVAEGEIVGLLGRNGAGKTTTFRMCVGMVTPDAGKVWLRNRDVTRLPMYKRARAGMGYLSQEPSVFKRMTVIDNVLAVLEARNHPRRERMDRALALLDGLQLTHLRDSYAETLSGGERRRLEISRSLAGEPALLLLDEPFAGVDPITVEEIQKILRKLRRSGISILITDHAVAETLRITDRAYILNDARVIAEGDAAQVTADPDVRKFYLGENYGSGGDDQDPNGDER